MTKVALTKFVKSERFIFYTFFVFFVIKNLRPEKGTNKYT